MKYKISQNVQNLGFFEKLDFFKIAKGGKFPVEYVSSDFIS